MADAYSVRVDHDDCSGVEVFDDCRQVRFQQDREVGDATLTLSAKEQEGWRGGVRFGEQLSKVGVA